VERWLIVSAVRWPNTFWLPLEKSHHGRPVDSISAMFLNDKDLLWPIIYRRVQDWEQSFVLQHSGLQPWLIDIRDALTDSQGLHTVSCEDLEVQIRYILFLLGRYATKGSSLLQACFEQPLAPYRPFGVGASVALICYAFMGISTNHIRGYESKEIWARDESFFFIMLDQLRKSPIFSPETVCGRAAGHSTGSSESIPQRGNPSRFGVSPGNQYPQQGGSHKLLHPGVSSAKPIPSSEDIAGCVRDQAARELQSPSSGHSLGHCLLRQASDPGFE